MTLQNEKILASILVSIVGAMAIYFVGSKDKAKAGIVIFLLGIILSIVIIKSEAE